MYAARVDPEHARELLARERARIEQALGGLAPRESDEPTTDQHLADQASDLYDAELDEGLSDDLRAELAAVERAEQRLRDGTYGLRSRAASRSPTSASRLCRRRSVLSKSKSVSTAADSRTRAIVFERVV